jgi:hypothetical protein
LNSKLQELSLSSNSSLYDFIVLTETWLSQSVMDGEVFDINSYNVFRCDRDFGTCKIKRGGGVLIAIKSNIKAVKLDTSNIGNLSEVSCVDLVAVEAVLGNKSLVICALYIPPGSKVDCYTTLLDFLISNNLFYNSDVIFLGDFNMPDYILWSQSKSSSSVYTHFSCFCNFFTLNQFNNVANNMGKLLDLVLSNGSCCVTKANDILLREDKYHPALHIEVCAEFCENFPTSTCDSYNYKKADFRGLYLALSHVDWTVLDSIPNPDEGVDLLYKALFSIFDEFVPKKRQSLGSYPLWFNREIIGLIKSKHKALKRYKHSRAIEDYICFKSLRSEVKTKIKAAYRNFIVNMNDKIKTNPKCFWGYLNSMRKTTSIPAIMNDRGLIIKDPKDIVNKFANYFSQSFNRNSISSIGTHNPTVNQNVLYVDRVTEREIVLAISKLKNNETCGPDQIPSFLIRDCRHLLAPPLKVIFNSIIKCSAFPVKWKESRITPVYKNGDRCEITNYRPIAIINNFSKIFELVLFNRIYNHVAHMTSFFQHGFQARRSTVTNLLSVTHFLQVNLDARKQIDVIYMDFSKAFDRVDHKLLLTKLDSFGFSDNLIQLIAS